MEKPSLFSFGVNEKKTKESDKFVGYSIPVCLWENESDSTAEEKQFFDSMKNIPRICQIHLQNEYGPDMASSLSIPLYYKQIEYTDDQ